MKKTFSFNSSIQSIEKINPLFSKAVIRVLYTGNNRNFSNIEKSVVENALSSVYNIPIVGEYIECTEDFGDHGVSVEISGDSVDYKVSTVPYGTVPESAEIYWEEVGEDDGTVNNYMVIDGAILWTGRYEELDIIKNKNIGHSMEIEIVEGEYAVVEGEEVFRIDEFYFSALCILGTDVEPAFESANIQIYSLSKDEFKKQFKQMMEELNFSLKGGDSMTENKKDETKLEDKKKYDTLLDEDTKSKLKFEDEEEIDSENGDDEDEGENGEDSGETPDPETEEPEPEVDTSELEDLISSSDYSSDDYTDESYGAYNQALENANSALNNADATQDDISNALQALQEAISGLEAKPETENVNHDDDNTTVDPMKKRRQPEDFEGKYEELLQKFAEVEAELVSLRDYKRKREEQDIKDKFSEKLSDAEIDKVFAEMKDSTMEDIEKELFAIMGQKNFSISSTEEKVDSIPITQAKERDSSPYEALEIYINKE